MIPARSRLEIGMIPVRSRFHHDFNHRKQGLNRDTWGWSWHWVYLRVHKTCGYGIMGWRLVCMSHFTASYLFIHNSISNKLHTFAVAWSLLLEIAGNIDTFLRHFYAGFTRHFKECNEIQRSPIGISAMNRAQHFSVCRKKKPVVALWMLCGLLR